MGSPPISSFYVYRMRQQAAEQVATHQVAQEPSMYNEWNLFRKFTVPAWLPVPATVCVPHSPAPNYPSHDAVAVNGSHHFTQAPGSKHSCQNQVTSCIVHYKCNCQNKMYNDYLVLGLWPSLWQAAQSPDAKKRLFAEAKFNA